MRPLLLALGTIAVALTAAPVQAQTPCVGGMAGNYPCGNVDLLARISRTTFNSNSNNDIWGWTHAPSGREFALVGLNNGTAFVEVTDPVNPVYLGKLPTATSNSTWRDIKTYADHAFIVSEASSHGLQVFDLTRLLDVTSPPVTFTHDARFTGFGSAHNIAIDDVSGFAYVVGSFQCSGGLYIVDIRNPLSPSQAGCFGSDGYTHDAQCLVYEGPDADYAGRQICVASNESHIAIVDVTNKAAPTLISRGFYPNPAYTHQGWFTDDFRYFLVDDELDSSSSGTRTLVMDVSDLDDPEFVFAHLGAVPTCDHNQYVRGRFVYQSNYAGGLRILDLSDLDGGSLSEVAFFDTYPTDNDDDFSGQWSNYPFFPSGTVVANDQSNGLFVLRPTLPQGVAAEIEPVSPPIVVPPTGGTFAFTAALSNPGAQAVTVDAWVAAVLPNGSDYHRAVAGPRTVTLAPGQTYGPLTLSARVPAAAPPGVYTIELRVGDYPGVVDASDSFTLTKQAAAEAPVASAEGEALGLSSSPNPFSERTAVRFGLAEAGEVRVTVYDGRGREVAVLVDGALPAGVHEATFPGTGLPSGTYFVVLQSGSRVERHALTLVR